MDGMNETHTMAERVLILGGGPAGVAREAGSAAR
jgi:spermidine synthase